MKIIYYSDKNDNCVKIINYLNKNNINNLFKIINIDNSKDPKEIKVIQTILNGKNLQHSLPFIIDINLNESGPSLKFLLASKASRNSSKAYSLTSRLESMTLVVLDG